MQPDKWKRWMFMKFRWIRLGFSLGLLLVLHGLAQAPLQPVRWTAAATPKPAAQPGSRITIEVTADLQEGWHVYALEQPADGPTPLRINLDENGVVQSAGAPAGSAPIKRYDPSFDLDTQIYARSFVLRLPVQVKPQSPAGKQVVPISVRFQACGDRMCLPPRTVHVSVPIEVLAGN
jgi:DsbC/DsbD-like thiol-disulfide interchange protein